MSVYPHAAVSVQPLTASVAEASTSLRDQAEPFDPLTRYRLRPVELADQPRIGRYFASLSHPLSDYTFSQLFSWRNSLRILFSELEGHLCVFANGTGDLTLLLPPIGNGESDRALRRCWEIMDDYNAAHDVADRSRIEYTSDELLGRLDRQKLQVQPMGADYLYDVQRMIDLTGGDLASKRQAKNRFLRNYQSRVETYDPQKHLRPCLALLEQWAAHQEEQHAADAPETASGLKRQKESLATQLSLQYAGELGLKGMVVYAAAAGGDETIRGFTFGEPLGTEQSSIVIEKTDLETKGLAQFIFSEFCRRDWAARPLVNVGDDWGLPTLAWTKMSYRPVKMLQKYVLSKPPRVMQSLVTPGEVLIRPTNKEDLNAALELEQSCFTTYSIKKRQLQYLMDRPNSVFFVAEQNGRVIGDCIALLRHGKTGITARLYSLAVSEQHRRQKIGRQLLEKVLDELALRHAQRAYLQVQQSNKAALALYEHLGFSTTRALPDYYGTGQDGWHMEREIHPPTATAAAA